jgi:heme A synthase
LALCGHTRDEVFSRRLLLRFLSLLLIVIAVGLAIGQWMAPLDAGWILDRILVVHCSGRLYTTLFQRRSYLQFVSIHVSMDADSELKDAAGNMLFDNPAVETFWRHRLM